MDFQKSFKLPKLNSIRNKETSKTGISAPLNKIESFGGKSEQHFLFQPRKLSSAEMKTAVDNKFSILLTLSISLTLSLSFTLIHSLSLSLYFSFTLSIYLPFLIFLTQLSNSYCRATCWWSTLARVHCFSKAPCYTCLRSTFRNFDHYASC